MQLPEWIFLSTSGWCLWMAETNEQQVGLGCYYCHERGNPNHHQHPSFDLVLFHLLVMTI